ncbi:MAG TPA: citryl-CoA lyase [Rhizomicrobium sp.]|jgi:citrate synthase|nr:citryl-CoA lyase [Rhizomicrobium sp.]
MRIGKQDAPFTAISTADAASITVRGRDLCKELIGKIDFSDYFFLLLMGTMPTPNQRFFVNALLVAIAEHGLVPSVQAARMTYAAGPEAIQGAVAAGLLGSGSVVFGSGEVAGRFLHELVAANADAAQVTARIREMRASKTPIPGFGHPQHSGGDPRANVLLELAKERGLDGPYIRMLHTVAAALPDALGRALPININGAIPAILLEIGFPVSALKSISILARTAGLLAHLREEAERPIGFVLSHAAAEAITYDGERAKP